MIKLLLTIGIATLVLYVLIQIEEHEQTLKDSETEKLRSKQLKDLEVIKQKIKILEEELKKWVYEQDITLTN